MHRAARSEQLAAWAVVDIRCRIKAEVGTREGAVLPVRPVRQGYVVRCPSLRQASSASQPHLSGIAGSKGEIPG
jgi:hypothetical protein